MCFPCTTRWCHVAKKRQMLRNNLNDATRVCTTAVVMTESPPNSNGKTARHVTWSTSHLKACRHSQVLASHTLTVASEDADNT